jgi:hypothetical protein
VLLQHGWWPALRLLGCCCWRAVCCSASSDTQGHINAINVSKLCCQRRSSSGSRRRRCSCSSRPAGCSRWRAARWQLRGCSLLPDRRPWR